MVAENERAEMAEQLIADSAMKGAVTPGILTMHADRGTSKRGDAYLRTLCDVTRRTAAFPNLQKCAKRTLTQEELLNLCLNAQWG
jgi:hypothetical protein